MLVTVTLVTIAMVSAIIGMGRRLGEIALRGTLQTQIEASRQASLAGLLREMPPGTLLIQQHPDGSRNVVVRAVERTSTTRMAA